MNVVEALALTFIVLVIVLGALGRAFQVVWPPAEHAPSAIEVDHGSGSLLRRVCRHLLDIALGAVLMALGLVMLNFKDPHYEHDVDVQVAITLLGIGLSGIGIVRLVNLVWTTLASLGRRKDA